MISLLPTKHILTKNLKPIWMKFYELLLWEELCAILEAQLRNEYSGTDEGIRIVVEDLGGTEASVIEEKNKQSFIFILMNVPNGVIKFSGHIEGLVETSLNLGILSMDEECINISFSVRSSVGSAKQ